MYLASTGRVWSGRLVRDEKGVAVLGGGHGRKETRLEIGGERVHERGT